jgi:hypothetical protein
VSEETGVQYILFEDPAKVERMARLYGSYPIPLNAWNLFYVVA